MSAAKQCGKAREAGWGGGWSTGGGVPGGVPGSCSGFPSGDKNLGIRPRGYFFMLRSILILPDLEIQLKSPKIRKNEFIKNDFFKF